MSTDNLEDAQVSLLEPPANATLEELVIKRIDNLRPKLLDLSRRNPLISTKLSARSISFVHVVDEVPDVLYNKLCNEQGMDFSPLPDLDDDPKDEHSRDFKNAYSEARLTDAVWMAELDALEQSDEEYAEKTQKLERKLKDRIRESLQMAPRQLTKDTSLAQHAKNNNISPSFDLPSANQSHEDGRHGDKLIQTLLLPDDLERKLNGLISKCNSWIQETGIHVLYAAFGFLEWTESKTSESSYSPLIMIPVDIEKNKTRKGFVFTVNGRENAGETNSVLTEKLRQEFGIDLPQFNGEDLETYFESIAALAPKTGVWKVRRQVVFGVFPSARIAMFRDLDPESEGFEINGVVTKLLGGNASGVESVFGDEYDVDSPELESKVPYLVLDADSSQFSTMIDVARGNDLAVEGPPGTGKSQTIVNIIAAALAEGKKVLFVAEKSAALDVVKSRLEAIGLGEFILPLQAERSTREQVIQSIRDRLEMAAGFNEEERLAKIHNYKEVRKELQQYIDLISSKVGDTGLTGFEVLGKDIAVHTHLAQFPKSLQQPDVDDIDKFDRIKMENAIALSSSVETCWSEASLAEKNWKGVKIEHLDKFAIEEVLQVAVDTARKLQDELDASSSLEPLEMDSSASCEQLEATQIAVQALVNSGQKLNFLIVEKLIQPESLPEIRSFISECDDWQKKHSELQQKFNAELDASLVQVLKDAIEHCSSNKISSLNLTQLRRELSEEKSKVDSFKLRERELSEFVKCFPESSVWRLDTFNSLADLVASVPAKALGKRKELFNDSSVVETAEQLCNAGTQLKQQRSQIENIISVPQSISSEKLRLYLKQFQNQSLLSLFNSEFKEAKKFYVAASKRHRFEKESAIKDLMELIDWKEQEEKFLANKNGMEIFGSTFDLETDFDLMKDLFAYYKKIDESYSGITNKDVRKFLKTAEKDVLLAIPQVEAIDSHFNYTELHKHIADAEQKISSKQANLETLESLLVVLKDLASYDIPGLLQLAKSVDGHFKTQKNLDANEKSREVLCECFAGARTRGEKIVGELKVAESLIPVADKYELLVRLFEADKCAALVEVLASYRKLRAESLAAQENFQQKTGLNVFKELSTLEEKCSSLSKAALDKDGLYLNSRLFGSIKRLDDYRLGWVVDELLNSHDSLQGLDKTIEAVVRRAMAKYMYSQKRDVLSRFNGTRLDEFRKRLKTLDQEILRLSRKSLRYKLQRNAHPPRGIGFGKKSEYTNMALLENELAKKKRFVPVRDLTRRAGTALLELKPCWMMSPLAVAQYIRKDDVYFDLVIIDEASQMPPEDALGALLRAQQALVVGDTNQLPPTAFFRKMMDDDDKDEDETVLDESILELANAAFRPSRRLRWHYRSRHSSLIAFSNHMVYNDDLVVFPAAEEQRADMGVSLVHVDGLYKSGANGDEAKVMIDAAINFMKTYPDRSLGLVTLNQKQRDLLQEEMDFALSKDTKAQAYIDYWKQEKDGLESFFIKNLENVQGDERDVIFIGTVYGRESHGAEVMQRFGPINGLAGKRRLNVLFSRAKKQIVTFSSMTSTDIKADESGNPGVYMLKKWLEYSASGIIQSGVKTARSTDSDFEDFVIAQIRSMGFQAEPQVGVAGYFIDIGVKHPDWGYGYILGVECDGAIYHSSKSARDRDRLRQEVLEGLGWNLHRIWSTDWFNDPKGQADKLRTILESRLQELRIRDKKMQRSEFASASSNVDSGSKIVQLSLLPDEVADDEDDDPDELTDSADDYSPAELTDSRRVYEVTRAEIDDAILAILKSCPNNSCTVKSMHTRVLKELKIITRGNPRIQFQKRVKTCIDNLVHKGVIEKYQSKNERVRLVT